MTLDAEQVLAQRMVTQRLVGTPLPKAADVVSLLTCVQSQEWAHAAWSLGMRSAASQHADVVAALDAGELLRTHILRPTWHLVAPADLGWILAATAERVHRINAGMYRQTGVDERTVAETADLLSEMLADHHHLTRAAVGERLGVGGIDSPTGMRLAYLVMRAELDGLIVSGAMEGNQHTYALVAERLAGRPVHQPEDPSAELWRRYVSGHGPTTVRDFARWSSLTLTVGRAAAARAAAGLDHAEVDGEELWWDPPTADAPLDAAVDAVRLVPLYDELTLSYPRLGFPLAEHHPHPPDADTRCGAVIAGLRNVGVWRRTIVEGRRRTVRVAVALAAATSRRQRAAVEVELDRLAAFCDAEPIREEWDGR